ncbi:hypothetical protein ASD36_25370 [Rhizobium sp. Root1334]|nr:hypothetical protein ASD36_25370 [Rhizobium sp. Root1334]
MSPSSHIRHSEIEMILLEMELVSYVFRIVTFTVAMCFLQAKNFWFVLVFSKIVHREMVA